MANHGQVVAHLSSARHRVCPILQRQLAILLDELGRIPVGRLQLHQLPVVPPLERLGAHAVVMR
eukprot:6923016-Prymnesium_polylepis.1